MWCVHVTLFSFVELHFTKHVCMYMYTLRIESCKAIRPHPLSFPGRHMGCPLLFCPEGPGGSQWGSVLSGPG